MRYVQNDLDVLVHESQKANQVARKRNGILAFIARGF